MGKSIKYSGHAERRRKQRGLSRIEIEQVIKYPDYKKKRLDNRIEVIKTVRNRRIIVIYEEEESYIKIVTVY